MSYATIDDLRSQLGTRIPDQSSTYAAKMLHQIPDAPVVDRPAFILERCQGKRVLEFGASGALQVKIRAVAAAYLGVDLMAGPDVMAFDLDDVSQPSLPDFAAEVIICGELLEHLSNPGWFLARLHRQYPTVLTIFTVPNGFGSAAQRQMRDGVEMVNRDHVCWYSFHTLKRLLNGAGYTSFWFGWYNGEPLTAEGLIVVSE